MKEPETLEEFKARKEKERVKALSDQTKANTRLQKLDTVLQNPDFHYRKYLKTRSKNFKRKQGNTIETPMKTKVSSVEPANNDNSPKESSKKGILDGFFG